MALESEATLITGCSTGIGRATAIRLAEVGRPVYATARNISAIADLADYGCELLALDVTDEESMVAAVDAVVDRHGEAFDGQHIRQRAFDSPRVPRPASGIPAPNTPVQRRLGRPGERHDAARTNDAEGMLPGCGRRSQVRTTQHAARVHARTVNGALLRFRECSRQPVPEPEERTARVNRERGTQPGRPVDPSPLDALKSTSDDNSGTDGDRRAAQRLHASRC